LGAAIADRYDSTVGHDDFTQAGDLYRLFDEGERARLAERIAGSLGQVRREVQLRQLGHFLRADAEYGRRVAEGLGLASELAELSGPGALAGAR
jgi:catalase